jgi:spermidine synthase/SAM-dependent methyltransferase
MSLASLLPKHHDEFRSKDYWDRFFRERGEEAFEWYGNYHDIEAYVKKYLKASESFLIIGCGNSNFSADFYDQGYHQVRNLDFSDIVIEEMKKKNATSRGEMSWDLGDMTDMSLYASQSFDIVIDKGALDALMSVDSDETRAKTEAMFREINRVLKDNGKYVCITLAEDYILDRILHHFITANEEATSSMKWCITFEAIDSSQPSPFKPFFLLISKIKNITSPLAGIVRMTIDNFGNILPKARSMPVAAVKETIASVQGFNQKRYDLSIIRAGRFDTVEIYGSDRGNRSVDIPRYGLLIVDVDAASITTRGLCAVFFIPQGREHEYQFATMDGLSTIARQAQYARLIAVRLNRLQSYASNTGQSQTLAIQEELSPIIISLAPRGCDPNSIPFMSIQQDTAWGVIAQGKTSMSGEYYIEESREGDHAIRRLIFLQNSNFIQTEVRLLSQRSENSSVATTKTKSSKKKSSPPPQQAATTSMRWEFDDSYLDPHHVAALLACVLSEDASLIHCCSRATATAATARRRGCIIGLGGGAFTMAMQRYLPTMQMSICDLDDALPAIAVEYFGFRLDPRDGWEVVIEDGLLHLDRYLATIATAESSPAPALSYLYLDADSKDNSSGITAPPAAFLTDNSLKKCYDCLAVDGIFVMNVVARDQQRVVDLLQRLRQLFATGPIFKIHASDEQVNLTIVAVKSSPTAIASNDHISRMTSWQQRLQQWLVDVGFRDDPLEMRAMLRRVEVIP